MTKKIIKQINKIGSIFGLLLYSAISSANYFAYVPDQANDEVSKYLHVINTTYNLYVDKILVSGTPRDVVLSHDGEYVFVSGVITEGTATASKINVISTIGNINTIAITVRDITSSKNHVRGLTLSSDDTALYVTHADGITRISDPTFAYIQTHLNLTYRGVSMVLSDDDKYLFVIGTDGNGNDGVSVVDVSQETMVEITSAAYSIGSDFGANSIVFDETVKELYIVTTSNTPKVNPTTGGQLLNLKINDYGTANMSLTHFQGRAFPLNSFPVDVALSPDRSEIYVALSTINNDFSQSPEFGFGDGYIALLDITNLNGPVIKNLDLSHEGGLFSPKDGSGATHPLALSFDDSGKLHVVKQLWNEQSGTYVSAFEDYIITRGSERVIAELPAVHLGKRSSSQLTGKFVGAKCLECPDGTDGEIQPIIRPSAISPFMLLFALIFLIPLRLKRRNETNHS